MPFYFVTKDFGTTTSQYSQSYSGDIYGPQYKYNGVVYGNKQNPYTSYSVYRANSYGSGTKVNYIRVSRSGLFNATLLQYTTSPTEYIYNAPATLFNGGGGTSTGASTVSGRYRLKDVATTMYELASFPVNFAIENKVTGQLEHYIEFGCSGWGTPPTTSSWVYFGGASLRKSYGIIMGKEPEAETGFLDYVRLTGGDSSASVVDAYKGSIVDFGNVEQEVPAYFVTWLNESASPIYPYTFTVKSQNGVDFLSSLPEAPAMVDVTPSVVGNVKTLTMTGVNGQTYAMTWESETPAGKQFLGLAYGANETRASIPTGRTTPVTWDGSLTIYEAYGTYRPPVTTFDINLYQSSAEVNRVDKTDYLTGVGTLSGVLREECSIIAPSITFKQTTVPTFNYVYIAAFGRYYYVTGITSVSKDIWRMSLSCDVLMTWKDDIRALTAIIARQENSFNPLLLDSELPAQANQNITVTEFPAGGFSTDSAITYPFILTVVGA